MYFSMNQQELSVALSDDQKILRRWLQHQFPNIPYGQWQKWFRTGQIRCDGKRVKGTEILTPGQKVRIPPFVGQVASNPKPLTHVSVSTTQLDTFKKSIVFESDDFLIINKPSGLAVQGGSNLKIHVDGLLQILYPENTPKLVHRLDKDTSGVLIVAKHHAAAKALTQAFANHTIQKEYWAITESIPRKQTGSVETLLEKGLSGPNMEKMLISATETAKPSKTSYTVIAKNSDLKTALLSLTPHTGRTHQLRVHCAHIHCPILGDKKYNPNTQSKQLHLHARTLTLPKELGGLTFTAEIPAYFEKTLDQYQLQVPQGF